jgi:hypothetical protein
MTIDVGPNYQHRRSPASYDCPNCDDMGCDLCQPAAKPAAPAQVPSQEDLVAILTRCFHRDASVNDTAAAVRELFAAVAPAVVEPAIESPPGRPPFKDLDTLYAELADEHGLQAELCSLEEYLPEKGRVPEFWAPRPRFLAFFKSAVQLGERRAMATFSQLGRGVHDGFQRAPFTDAYRRLVPDAVDWQIGLAWRSEAAEAQRNAILLAAIASSADNLGNQVTLTGHQLKQALSLAWPDGDADPDQGFTVVTIAHLPAGRASNEDGQPVDMPAGLYLSYDDMPDEGSQQLLEEPDPRAASAPI